MPMQKQSYQIVGMKQDNLVGTGFSTKFAHEIKNMRLNTIGDYTTGVWTTEKGTLKLNVVLEHTGDNFVDTKFPQDREHQPFLANLDSLQVVGQAVLNDQWVIFGKITYDASSDNVVPNRTKNDVTTDCILRLFYEDNALKCDVLYFGNLGFNAENPIETLPYYENEEIQKVYWTDGINQPRVINIVNVKQRSGLSSQFDFVREVALNEVVHIKKLQSGTGLFPPCTVKYALTYYDKYGQETNIVYDSPLYYPTKGDRGCSPDELSSDSFEITVRDLDTNFDYIRLYSIIRTSNNATPIVRLVAEQSTAQTVDGHTQVTFVDTNTTGQIIDPDFLKYVGGRNITAQTFDQKSNTLFLGNLELKTKSAQQSLANENFNNIKWQLTENDQQANLPILKARYYTVSGTYPYTNQLVKTFKKINSSYIEDLEHVSSRDIKNFKKGEKYTFGLQFQDKYGIWSDVVSVQSWVNSENNKDYYSHITDNTFADIYFSCPTIELTSNNIKTLIENDYKKVRMVRAEKNNTNRQIIAQGVVDSTMMEQATINRHNNPYRYVSWFFRPKERLYTNNNAPTGKHVDANLSPQGAFTFGYGGCDNVSALGYAVVQNSEEATVQRSDWIDNFSVEVQNEGGWDYTKPYQNNPRNNDIPKWKVKRDWLTFHSPELDFDESVNTLDLSNVSCKIVGYVPIDAKSSNWYVSTAEASLNDFNYTDIRFFTYNNSDYSDWDYRTHLQRNPAPTWYSTTTQHSYRCDLFPFQRNGGLSNIAYQYKIYSTLLISKIPIFQGTLYIYNNTEYTLNSQFYRDILNGDFQIYNKNSEDYVTLPNCNEKTNLCAKNVKTLAPFVNPYPLMGIYDDAGEHELDLISSPISMTYKTSTLGLFKTNLNLSSDDAIQVWLDGNVANSEVRPYLWLTEISREIDFTEDAKNLVFVPCGPALKLPSKDSLTNQYPPLVVYGLEGDHYFMRYDCLKTFPYSTSDKNQIVEILSFMCETRVNLDGRYDKKRGLLDNTTVTDTNFNLINYSYTQDNNFFTYTVLDELSAKLDKFSNQITYTDTKVAGEDVDAWTHITLASTADAEGTSGKINKIININDKLFLFQDHGIARIGFNDTTAISTENNVPLELIKTGKYTGLDYITKEVGCQNKWSIARTKNSLFWIDDSRRELLTLDEGISSVSTLNGFDSFIINNCNTKETWNSKTFNNFISYYDKLSKDVYFINKNTCLAWNEISKSFTSFYDYDKVTALASIDNHTLMFRTGGVYAARESAYYSTFFYNDSFVTGVKDYWMTIVCDGQTDKGSAFPADKVFNNIEYRADLYNLNDTPTSEYGGSIFNIKHAWNGYQDSQEVALDGERKFNTWRVQLPRHHGTRDRIRNPFCYIQLKQVQSETNPQTDRVILHDLAVYFDMR